MSLDVTRMLMMSLETLVMSLVTLELVTSQEKPSRRNQAGETSFDHPILEDRMDELVSILKKQPCAEAPQAGHPFASASASAAVAKPCNT